MIERYLREASECIFEKAHKRMREYKARLPIDIDTSNKVEHTLYWEPTKSFDEWHDENIKHIKKEFEIELMISDILNLGIEVWYSNSSLEVTCIKPNTEP